MTDELRKMAMKAKYFANIENENTGVDYQETFENIFAKMIIEECAIMVDKATGRRGNNTIGELLKTHFGVEQ